MDKVRIGIIGIGVIGSMHAEYLLKGQVPGAELSAVCDIKPERLEWAKQKLGENVRRFDNQEAFFASKDFDAVIIASYHYDHPAAAVKAFRHGYHVLIEKPAGVYGKQVLEMNEAAANSGKVFGIMYNQRTNPMYKKLRDLVQSGELGEIKRTQWTVTNWYRTQCYYDSSDWRASWAGEGGGVLINQCPHQLDLWQWICGMPKRVRSFCSYGKYHNIEVEDDVTAYVEYANGATGLFVTSTGEAPGTNRFEVAGNNGKVVVEDDRILFWRLRVPERQFNAQCTNMSQSPECWKCEVPVQGDNSQHVGITRNWVESIRTGSPLLAPGEEGINGLRISNAIHLSDWIGDWVDIPADEDLFYARLREKIGKSRKTAVQ